MLSVTHMTSVELLNVLQSPQVLQGSLLWRVVLVRHST